MRKVYRQLEVYFPNTDLFWINELERLEIDGQLDMQTICRNALRSEYEKITGKKAIEPQPSINGCAKMPIEPDN